MSTRLFEDERLRPEHLTAIAGHGFEAVELFAASQHFDYHDPAAIQTLASWLRDTRLEMPSVRAPGGESIAELRAALEIARHLPFARFVLPLDAPNRGAAIRTIEELHGIAEPLGVTLALEVADTRLSAVDSLLDLIENDFEDVDLGICLDTGHAFLSGDTAEAIETAGGYLTTTHLHDNKRQRDDHLVPFQGAIDWAGVVMAFEKIGYDGVFMFEVNSQQNATATLERSARARTRLERLAPGLDLDASSW